MSGVRDGVRERVEEKPFLDAEVAVGEDVGSFDGEHGEHVDLTKESVWESMEGRERDLSVLEFRRHAFVFLPSICGSESKLTVQGPTPLSAIKRSFSSSSLLSRRI